MRALAIHNGDLALGPGGYATVSGADKVRQDLGVAVREPLGCDRFHPRWGSTLPGMVGRPISASTEMTVRGEINRLIQNYVAMQADTLASDAARGNKSRFGAREVISSIESIDVRQEMDRIHVRATVRTLSGEPVVVTRTAGL